MKMILSIAGGITALLIAAAIITYFFFPGVIVKAAQSAAASKADLERKIIHVEGYDVHYYEGGEGPVLLLLHGMGDEKNSFVAASEFLTDKYRVILPDLRGHGENARDATLDYSIRGQVDFVEAFVEALDLSSFSIGGNSMGGHTAVAYSLHYPERVDNLIIVNAPGLVLDNHIVYTGFEKRLESKEDLYAIFDRVLYQRPDMPGPVVAHLIKRVNADFEFLSDIAVQIRTGQDHALNDRVSEIRVPTLILWGAHDEVVKFNVAEAYHEMISGSELKVFENASHSPQLEIAEEIGTAMLIFLEGQ